MRTSLRMWAACGLICLCVSGCLVSHESNVTRSGQQVTSATLAQMEPGKSTADWAKAVIGSPTTVQKLEDGTELWKWCYSERKTNHGTVFLLFNSNDVQNVESTVFAEFKDGVLVRCWQS